MSLREQRTRAPSILTLSWRIPDKPPRWKVVVETQKDARILQDKVRMLGALILCSSSEQVFCCTLLTLQCACVNEWHTLHEASEDPCSTVPRWPHTAYGRNLLGVYTDLPLPIGTQCLLQEQTRNGQSVWTELSFLGQTFWSHWPFHNFLGIRTTNLSVGS